MNSQDINYGNNATNMIAWLQSISKTSKSSPRHPLEQQLQTLSLSYKNAQQKLLSLQRQVYHESLYNQKQRSIIQILKYIINGSLDDETILTYLVDMQDQSVSDLDTKYEIRGQLQQIKQIVLKRKTQDKKQESMKSIAIVDLKKQLVKCNQIKKELMEDLDRTLNEKGALQTVMEEMKHQAKNQQQSRKRLQKTIQQLSAQLWQVKKNNQCLEKQLSTKSQFLRQKQQILRSISQFIQKMANMSVQIEIKNILKQMNKIQQKLQKYRSVAKQLSQKIKKNNNGSQMITILKQFLPQQAITLCQQYEKSSQKCLLKQIEGIAKLQRKKYSQLEHCQQQVWRLKSKLLRQGGSWLKSGRTGATISGNKQNTNPNHGKAEQGQVAQFQIEEKDKDQ